jgi:hypothetical protein
MYEIVKKGTEYELFTKVVINGIQQTITNEIAKMLEQTKNPKPVVLGSFALKDVPMKNGSKSNVWIEYNANLLPNGLVDAGVHECIIFDEIPDIVLDKFNDIKTFIYEQSK